MNDRSMISKTQEDGCDAKQSNKRNNGFDTLEETAGGYADIFEV